MFDGLQFSIAYPFPQVSERVYRAVVGSLVVDSRKALRDEVVAARAYSLTVDAGTMRSSGTQYFSIHASYMTVNWKYVAMMAYL